MNNNFNFRKILVELGLGGIILYLSLKNSRLKGENETLKQINTDLNNRCDYKDRTIGKILTEFKNQDKH
jgi:hypothetical protein